MRSGRGLPVPWPEPAVIEALVPLADGSAVAVRIGGRTVGRIDPGAIRELGLHAGQALDDAGGAALLAACARRAAFESGVRLLARRARSRAALEARLCADHGAEAAAVAVARLAAHLDDRRFARDWAEARLRRGFGRSALLAGLRREGVAPAVARDAVEAVAPQEMMGDMAVRAAAARLARMRGVPPERVRPRLWGYLRRHGFAEREVSRALRVVLEDDGGDGSARG